MEVSDRGESDACAEDECVLRVGENPAVPSGRATGGETAVEESGAASGAVGSLSSAP